MSCAMCGGPQGPAFKPERWHEFTFECCSVHCLNDWDKQRYPDTVKLWTVYMEGSGEKYVADIWAVDERSARERGIIDAHLQYKAGTGPRVWHRSVLDVVKITCFRSREERWAQAETLWGRFCQWWNATGIPPRDAP